MSDDSIAPAVAVGRQPRLWPAVLLVGAVLAGVRGREPDLSGDVSAVHDPILGTLLLALEFSSGGSASAGRRGPIDFGACFA